MATEGTIALVSRKELGLRLHTLRYDRGWKLIDVETKTGIPQSTLSRWERARGKGYPDVERLAILADLYGTEVSALLDGDLTSRVWSKPDPKQAAA